MKKELKYIRIVTDNGEAVLISKEEYYSLLETLDLLANGFAKRNHQGRSTQFSNGRKASLETG